MPSLRRRERSGIKSPGPDLEGKSPRGDPDRPSPKTLGGGFFYVCHDRLAYFVRVRPEPGAVRVVIKKHVQTFLPAASVRVHSPPPGSAFSPCRARCPPRSDDLPRTPVPARRGVRRAHRLSGAG